MNYILLFVALTTSTPAYLGTYRTEQECKNAIMQIYTTRMVPPNVPKSDAMSVAIATKAQYQQEFACVPTSK